MSRSVWIFFFVSVTGFLSASMAIARDDMREQRVQFEPGDATATVDGTITGYEAVDYLLGARAGQTMSVTMTTDHGATYFNVLPPDSEDEADFVGSTEGNSFSGRLDLDGDWKVRVYMMRSAARRNEAAKYRLEMIISDAGDKSSSLSNGHSGGDALVEGTKYNATGNIPCSMPSGQPVGSCPFGVIRKGNGNATVTVTKPDGRTRAIFFENGKAIGADISQADPGDFGASRESDVTVIHIGNERYDIPDAVIFGG